MLHDYLRPIILSKLPSTYRLFAALLLPLFPLRPFLAVFAFRFESTCLYVNNSDVRRPSSVQNIQ